MCLYHFPKEAEFALKDRKPEDWMVGYKVLEVDRYVEQIVTPYQRHGLDLYSNTLYSSSKATRLKKNKGYVVHGIHFFKTKDQADRLSMQYSYRFVVPVYVQVKDIIGVGYYDVVAKKVYFLNKTLKMMQRKIKNV